MRVYTVWAALLLCLLLCGAARAEGDIAVELTKDCAFSVSYHRDQLSQLTDADYCTIWQGARQSWVEITLPEEKPCYGLYICFGKTLTDWAIQVQNSDGAWETVYTPEDTFYHQYVPLSGQTHMRIYSCPQKPKQPLAISEIRLLGKGTLPGWVQVWHRLEGKADLMVVAAHPDDEYLFMGGTIPYYAGELKQEVLVVYLADTHSRRKSELLDGLWHCGVRDYPELGTMIDYRPVSLQKLYRLWSVGQLRKGITRLIRKYRPDVVVTHDVKGEYGHAAHQAAADACKKCLLLAQDSCYDEKSAAEYGTWKILKLYLHLYKDRQMHMDWQKPLPAFSGRTALQVAEDAFELHISQQHGKHNMQNAARYDPGLFGLYHSTVGPDEIRNDFFEHLPSAGRNP